MSLLLLLLLALIPTRIDAVSLQVAISLPSFHADQQECYAKRARFNVYENGRRWGKSKMAIRLVIEPALEGFPTSWFAPNVKFFADQWEEVARRTQPLHARNGVSKQERKIKLVTGGEIDFWSLENVDSGRGRKYKRVVIDEAGIARYLEQNWQQAIRATLTDLLGDAWFFGTPKGSNFFHRLYLKGEQGRRGWASFRRGTIHNPFIDKDEIEEARLDLPEDVFNQEYLGIPAPDGGNPFGLDAIARAIMPELAEGPAHCYGSDLARTVDYTVLAGLNAQRAMCDLDRWQTAWQMTREKLVAQIGDTPALVDSTGVGAPVVEDLQSACANVEGYVFTQPSKQALMENLAVSFQNDLIKIVGGSGANENWLRSELEMFMFEYTKTGVRFTAPPGFHDDGVCALALADWHYGHMVPYQVGTAGTRTMASELQGRARTKRGVGASLNGFGV